VPAPGAASTPAARHGKVINTSDADVDGAHIPAPFFTLFFRYMPG
jgi:DNA gyrase/topoisomerase IV subunit B